MSRKASWSDDLEPFSRLEPGTLGRAIGSMPYERLADEPLQPEPLPAPSAPTATPGPANRPACASTLASEPFSRLLPGTLGRAMGCSSYVRFADEPRQPEPPKPVAAPAAAAATATPGPRSASGLVRTSQRACQLLRPLQCRRARQRLHCSSRSHRGHRSVRRLVRRRPIRDAASPASLRGARARS